MSNPLHKKLDEISTLPVAIRKVSTVKTKECTVFNRFENLWMESDKDFAKRIREKNV